MNKKVKIILITSIVSISLVSLITFKTINNFNHKKEVAKQQEIIRIENENKAEEINKQLEKLDLGKLTINDKEKIEQIYQDYQDLDRSVKSIVDNTKLNKLYKKIRDLQVEQAITNSDEQKEQLERMKKEIKKLPSLDKLTLDDALSINLLIQQYNELTSENQKEINYKTLEKYKAKIEELKNK